MHLPEEIQIHILTIQKYAPNDLKSIKLCCRHFIDIVNRYIVLVVTSIASWKSHDWTYDQIYSTKRVMLILSSTDYASNKTVPFVDRFLRRRLKGSVQIEVWFTEVDKTVTLQRYSPLKPTYFCNQCGKNHVIIPTLRNLPLVRNLRNQPCSYLQSLGKIKAYKSPAYYHWTRTKGDLERLFKKLCWLRTKLLINGKDPNTTEKKYPGFWILFNIIKNIF